MHIKLLVAVLIAVTFCLSSAPVQAMDTWSIDTLRAYCAVGETGEEEPADACFAYVRGFIDGAIATDPRVTLNIASELDTEETFAERAYRTRLGQRLNRYGPSYFAEFCIPQPAPLSEIVAHVRAELGKWSEDSDSARELVYRVLRAHYPCERAED